MVPKLNSKDFAKSCPKLILEIQFVGLLHTLENLTSDVVFAHNLTAIISSNAKSASQSLDIRLNIRTKQEKVEVAG